MAESRRKHEWELASHQMWIMAEVNRDRRKRARPFRPDEFNPLTAAKTKPIPITVQQLGALLGKLRKPHKTTNRHAQKRAK